MPGDSLALDDGATIVYQDGSEAAHLEHAGLGPQSGHKVKDRPYVSGLGINATSSPS